MPACYYLLRLFPGSALTQKVLPQKCSAVESDPPTDTTIPSEAAGLLAHSLPELG